MCVGRSAAARSWAATASRASTSSRSCSAVRASASATPPDEHVLQQRQHLVAQPDAGEAGVGVVRVVPHGPSPAQAARVVARRTVSSGRSHGGSHRRMPASERAPDPRPRPSSTVSAWSSRVWPSRIGLSGCGRAAQQRGLAGAAGGRLDPTRPGDVHGVHPRRDPALGQQRDGGRRAFGRPLLEPVVDDRGLHVVRPRGRPPRRGSGRASRRRRSSRRPAAPAAPRSGRAANASRTARRTSKIAVRRDIRAHERSDRCSLVSAHTVARV